MLKKKLLWVAMGLMATTLNASIAQDVDNLTMQRPLKPLNPRPGNMPPPTRPAPPLPSSQSAANIKPESPRTEKQAVSVVPNLESQLLDPATEKFFKEIISDEYNSFKAVQCIFNSLKIEKEEFNKLKGNISKKLKKIILGKNTINSFSNYDAYIQAMGQFYGSLANTALIPIFQTIDSKGYKIIDRTFGPGGTPNPPEIVSPFANGLSELITRTIRFASDISPKIPGSNPATNPHPTIGYIMSLPPQKLQKLEGCFKNLAFKTDKLQKTKEEILTYINKYMPKK